MLKRESWLFVRNRLTPKLIMIGHRRVLAFRVTGSGKLYGESHALNIVDTLRKSANTADVKAALLTYDTVQLLVPADRDLFPATATATATAMGIALGMPPLVSIPTPNPVGRIGKTANYDDDFSAVVDAAKAAVHQGNVSVVRTYEPPSQSIQIGRVDVGGFPLDLRVLLDLFRSVAADPDFLAAAVRDDRWLFEVSDRVFAVAEGRGNADGKINSSPPLPDVNFEIADERLREPLSNVARARSGHTIKLIDFCKTQGLVPHGTHQWHDSILRTLLRKSTEFVDRVAEVDPYCNYRSRALKLVHDEYLDMTVLDQMSVEDVLKLRTEAWGRQAESRDALFDAVGQLARQACEEDDFEKAVLEQIRDYRQKAAEVEDERAALLFKLNCGIGKAVLAGTGALTAGGAVTALGTGIGVGAALLAVAYFALQQYQDLKPIADKLRQAESDFKLDTRFGIHNFYDRST